MADRAYDTPEAKTLRGRWRQARVGAAMKDGVKTVLTMNSKDRPDMWASIPALAAMATGPLLILTFSGGENVTVAQDPLVTAAIAQGRVSSVLVHEGAYEYKYTLVLGPQGYEVYRAGDHSDHDDRLTQMRDPAQALQSVSRVVQSLQAVQDAAQGNLLTMPNVKALPAFLTYDRISGVFNEAGQPGDFYRVGDEVHVDTQMLRLSEVTQQLAFWRQAAVAIAGGAYSPPEAAAQGHHLYAGNLLPQAFAMMVASYAGLAGLGALGGAAAALRRNRKQRDMKA